MKGKYILLLALIAIAVIALLKSYYIESVTSTVRYDL